MAEHHNKAFESDESISTDLQHVRLEIQDAKPKAKTATFDEALDIIGKFCVLFI